MSDRMRIAYIAGPITDDPKYEGKFNAAADLLMLRGYAVVNPVKRCAGLVNDGWNCGEIMAYCFEAVIGSDCLMLLPGWENSQGTKAELQVFLKTHKVSDFDVCKIVDGLIYKVPMCELNNIEVIDSPDLKYAKHLLNIAD